jgi:hypothetical protein
MDRNKLDSFVKGYIVAALWSTNDESTPSGGNPLDANYGIEDVSDELLEKMVADCDKFRAENADDLKQAYERYNVIYGTDGESYAGHDFWLTRNGHGCGFWDRDELEADGLGERLTDAAQQFGECWIYDGSDDKIHG